MDNHEGLIPIMGIDIGGTMSKVCFAMKKGSIVKCEHLPNLTSLKKNKKKYILNS